jgi:hypothetical protein
MWGHGACEAHYHPREVTRTAVEEQLRGADAERWAVARLESAKAS